MKNSLLERFNLKYQNPEKEGVYIFGIDFGDGEYAAAKAFMRTSAKLNPAFMKTSAVELENLQVNNAKTHTAFAVYGQKWKDGEMSAEGIGEAYVVQDEVRDHSYANFKRLPGNGPGRSSEFYNDSRKKKLTGYTYGYLMSHAFCCLIDAILQEAELLKTNIKKHIYLFIGRPSSPQWEQVEKSYAEMLAESLKSYPNVDFHIAVVSEAKAAMASEYFAQRQQIAQGIKPNMDIQKETIAIIDGGSSTFDCVVVKDGRVICEYSRQIGAGKLDKNFLDILLFSGETVQECAQRLNLKLPENIREEEADKQVTKAAVTTRRILREEAFAQRDDNGQPRLAVGGMGKTLVSLREAKERYFGPNGNDGDSDAFYRIRYNSQNGDRTSKKLDFDFQDVLGQAVNEMPVIVEASYSVQELSSGHLNVEYPSFAEALKAFYQGARTMWEKNGIEKPDRIIVTGGATLMPFVNDIMESVFETKKQGIKVSPPTWNRHYSVSKGIAYIGFVELYKEKIYREVCEECDGFVEDMENEIKTALLRAATDFRWKDCLSWVETWQNDPQCSKFSDLNYLQHDPPQSPWTWSEQVHEKICTCIRENLLEKLQTYLKEKTKKMFPEAQEFQFDLNVDDLAKIECDQPTMHFNIDFFRGNGLLNQLSQRFQNGIPMLSQNKPMDSAAKAVVVQNVRNNEQQFRSSIRNQLPSLKGQVETARKTIIQKLHKQMESYVEQMDDFFIREDFKQI